LHFSGSYVKKNRISKAEFMKKFDIEKMEE